MLQILINSFTDLPASNALRTTKICVGHKQDLTCDASKPYIDIISVDLLAACEVRGDGCSLSITTGSALSDRCNRYNQKILQRCQGQKDECTLSYSSLIVSNQADNLWDNPECNSQTVKAFNIQYNCSNDQSLQLQADVISLVKECVTIDSTTATSRSLGEDILLPPGMTRTGKFVCLLFLLCVLLPISLASVA